MLLIIDNYDSFTYNLYQAFAVLTDSIEVIRNDAITVDEVIAKNPSAIILSPGPGIPENAGICIDLIKTAAPTIPILGVCLGHQAIACAFGGNVVRCNDVVHGKTANIFHNRKDLFNKLPLPFSAGRYHSLVVDRETLPIELIVEAELMDGTVMAIRHAKYPSFGLQFHPESILSPDGPRLLQQFLQHVDSLQAKKELTSC